MRLRTVLAASTRLCSWSGSGSALILFSGTAPRSLMSSGRLAVSHRRSRKISAARSRRSTPRSDRFGLRGHAIRAGFDLASWERESGLTSELTLQISMSDRVRRHPREQPRPRHGPARQRRGPREISACQGTQPVTSFLSVGLGLDVSLASGRCSSFANCSMSRGAFDGVIVASLDPALLARFYTSLNISRCAVLLLGQDGIVRSVGPSTAAGVER